MRAVSIRQPWAWAAVNGRVRLLNMSWPTPFRGTFLIRAGLKLVQRDYREAAAQLRNHLHIEVPAFDDAARVPRGGIVGMARVVGVAETYSSPLFTGPYAWLLEGAQPLPFAAVTPAHSGPDLRWFDVPRAVAGLPTPCIERLFA